MIVERIMTRELACCGPNDTLERAAQLMWDHDCGILPVIDGGRLVGVVTDRDACMAAYTKGQPLASIRTGDVMSRHVRTCRPDDELSTVEQRMRLYRVRRMPVVEGERVVGMVSLNDLALAADRGHGKHGFPSAEDVVHTLAAICERASEAPSAE